MTMSITLAVTMGIIHTGEFFMIKNKMDIRSLPQFPLYIYKRVINGFCLLLPLPFICEDPTYAYRITNLCIMYFTQ